MNQKQKLRPTDATWVSTYRLLSQEELKHEILSLRHQLNIPPSSPISSNRLDTAICLRAKVLAVRRAIVAKRNREIRDRQLQAKLTAS